MDENIRKKLDEITKKVDDKNKATALVNKQDEEEKSRLEHEFQQEKENLLNEIKMELSEFEPKLLPLSHRLLDKREFYMNSNTRYTIVATEDQRIETFVSSSTYMGNPSIYDLANDPRFEPDILNILRFFLIGLKRFEKYYVDNVEKHLK